MHVTFQNYPVLAICFALLFSSQASLSQNKGGVKLAIEKFQRDMAEKPDYIYSETKRVKVQPENIVEKCQTEIGVERSKEPNVRIFWDGKCRNGIVHGVGREIIISDKTHIDEIVIHYTDENIIYPIYKIDYINNGIYWGKHYPRKKTSTFKYKKFITRKDGLIDVNQITAVLDEKYDALTMLKYPQFSSEKSLHVSVDGKITYYKRDFSSGPNKMDAIIGMYDSNTSQEGGARRVIFRNNDYRDEILDGLSRSLGEPRDSDWNQVFSILEKGFERINTAQNDSELPSEIAGRYILENCVNRAEEIKGIPKELFYKICDWEMSFDKKIKERAEVFSQKQALALTEFEKNKDM